MIDESFIQSAIRIRRQYLKLTNNMDLYKKKATEVVNNLDDILLKIENIKQRYEDKENPGDPLNEFLKVLKDLEEEGKRLEESVDPLNLSLIHI